jgi:hypothetical protein
MFVTTLYSNIHKNVVDTTLPGTTLIQRCQLFADEHTKLVCKDEDIVRYNQFVQQHLNDNPQPQTTEEAITTLHTAITETVTTIKPKHVHRTKGKHGTRIQADIRALGKILRCLKRGTSLP